MDEFIKYIDPSQGPEHQDDEGADPDAQAPEGAGDLVGARGRLLGHDDELPGEPGQARVGEALLDPRPQALGRLDDLLGVQVAVHRPKCRGEPRVCQSPVNSKFLDFASR